MVTKCESLSLQTKLSLEEFNEFDLPHLATRRGRGPPPKLPLHLMFNYILKLLIRPVYRSWIQLLALMEYTTVVPIGKQFSIVA
jgi:hypothetical protein